MIKRNQKLINRLNVVTDIVIIIVSYLFSSWLWLDVIQKTTGNIASFTESPGRYLLFATIYALWTAVILACFHLYRTSRTHRTKEAGFILAANLIALISVAAALYVFRLQEFSRGVLGVFYLTSSLILISKRFIGRKVLRYFRKKGYNIKHFIVVGDSDLAGRFIASVVADKSLGIRVDEQLMPDENLLDELYKKLYGTGIDEVVLALAPEDLSLTTDVINVCEKCGTKISIILFYNDIIPTQPKIDMVGSMKLIQLRTTPLDEPVNAFAKRAFDLAASVFFLILLSPLMLLIALGIKLTSPGPVLFKQKRVGYNKQDFYMYKFRSMRVNTTQDTAWSTDKDDRRTKFGSLLRKTSLDELPQLLNILKGDMSLVGPRPEIPYFVEQFRETIPLYMVKCQVRPGITGWAQVNGLRGDTSIPERIKYDLWYIENWSFGLDIKILLKTVLVGMINQEKLPPAGK